MIRPMRKEDWPRVAAIYRQGIEGGEATFTRVCPDYAQWDENHAPFCRFVAEEDGEVIGWAALLPTSKTPAYAGVLEVSVYVAREARGKGAGSALLAALCAEAGEHGVWTLHSNIFRDNAASVRLHEKHGFRLIGYRERIARDIRDNWRDTVMMERRL